MSVTVFRNRPIGPWAANQSIDVVVQLRAVDPEETLWQMTAQSVSPDVTARRNRIDRRIK